mmetsp:Transcript_7437/g.12261  ORF Transcript_7437/g.12261 Transcript_7437/m.12261 type:complete len:87 (+) Transcript_7437:846-1106(+)
MRLKIWLSNTSFRKRDVSRSALLIASLILSSTSTIDSKEPSRWCDESSESRWCNESESGNLRRCDESSEPLREEQSELRLEPAEAR